MFDRHHPLRGPMILLAALVGFTGACDDQESSVAGPQEASPQATPLNGGTGFPQAQAFTVVLTPLNDGPEIRPVHGSAMVKVQDGRLTVEIDAHGLERGIPHPQHIHGKMGVGSCPDASADENGDGLIDVVEGLPDYGGILVTLDSDLTNGATTEVEGLPRANRGGVINYTESADLAAVQEGASMDLNLKDRHIVLHGVDPDLQETLLSDAASIGDLPAWLTLPVACGELVAEGRGTIDL